MESYMCSNVPHELYRVNGPGPRTIYTSQEGFKAADTSRTFGVKELLVFKRSIEQTFTWKCQDALPFISLFSDREHAEIWGRRKPCHGSHRLGDGWALYVIDATELRKTTLLFNLSSLVGRLKLDNRNELSSILKSPTYVLIASHQQPLLRKEPQRRSRKMSGAEQNPKSRHLTDCRSWKSKGSPLRRRRTLTTISQNVSRMTAIERYYRRTTTPLLRRTSRILGVFVTKGDQLYCCILSTALWHSIAVVQLCSMGKGPTSDELCEMGCVYAGYVQEDAWVPLLDDTHDGHVVRSRVAAYIFHGYGSMCSLFCDTAIHRLTTTAPSIQKEPSIGSTIGNIRHASSNLNRDRI